MGERLCLTKHTGEKHVLQWSSLARPYFEWNIYLPPQSQLALGRSTSLAGGCPLSTRAPDVSVSPTSPPALSSAPELSPHSTTTRGYWGRLGTVGVGSLHPHLVLSEQGSHLKAPLSHGPVCRNCMQNCVTRCIWQAATSVTTRTHFVMSGLLSPLSAEPAHFRHPHTLQGQPWPHVQVGPFMPDPL